VHFFHCRSPYRECAGKDMWILDWERRKTSENV